jgi:DNA (cytosine-5)-methyltransferase 1
MSRDLTVISLYTGAGGLDYGFEAAGFRTALGVEMDPLCAETLRNNRPWPVFENDIKAVPTHRLLRVGGLKAGEADVLIGGPPCQPFSKSGYWATGDAKRLADPRAATLEEYLRVVEEAQPKAFLMENVEGLGFRGKDEGLQYVRQRLAQINRRKRANYGCDFAVLNAADYGVPQLRRRLFMVGARNGSPFKFPTPTHMDAAEPDHAARERHRTAWDALHDLPSKGNEDLRVRGKWADLLPSIPEGQNYLWHTDRGGGEPLFGWRRRFWSFLLKLAKSQPSWTIQAQPGPATGPFHWSNRRLSVREMSRLQTFPESIMFAGSYADAQRQLGNAVPSLLAEVLAREIRGQLLDSAVRTSKPRLRVEAAPEPPPPPECVLPVPKRYLQLRGDHEAHPGTGRGYSAVARPELLV